MSAFTIGNLNGVKTASVVYFQTSPSTAVNMGSQLTSNGTTVAYTFASSPWATSTPINPNNMSGLNAKINSDGGIQVTSKCRLTLKWCLALGLTSGSATLVNYCIASTNSTVSPTLQQTNGNVYPLDTGTVVNLGTSQTILPALSLSCTANAGDVFYLFVGGTTVARMSLGQLFIETSPIV